MLQQGASELSASSRFKLEANGLSVIPKGANSHVVVSLRAGNTVEIAVSAGSFGVLNGQGILLASVSPGQSASFAVRPSGDSSSFTGTGVISAEAGNYFVTVGGVKYQVIGQDLSKKVGKTVKVTGAIVSGTTPAAGAAAEVAITSISIIGGIATGWIVAGTVIGIGSGVGVRYAVERPT